MATAHNFTHQEIGAALVRAAGIHEGKWQLAVSFAFTGGNFGPSDKDVHPGAIVSITGITLAPAVELSPPALVIDAAEANPRKTAH